MNYAPPKSFYDIFPNDYVNWNFVPPVGNFAGGAPAGTPRYGFQYPGGGGPALVPMTAPVFQAPAPFETTFTGSAGSPTTQSTISSHPTPPGPSTPSSQDMAQLFQEPGASVDLPVSTVAPPARRKAKRTGTPRPRGPNKRRPGSGYVDMMNTLSIEVQHALQQEYPNCCEVVRGKDPSTVQKHRFTRRHSEKVDPRYQGVLPSFTCPAFVGMDEQCKNAKFGRYDSTERHCIRCPGFIAMGKRMQSTDLYPFQTTKEEFEAVRDYRKTNAKAKADPDTSVRAPALVEAALFKLISTLTGATCSPKLAVSESQPADDLEDAELDEEQPSPSSLPMYPSSSVQPEVAAPASWPDAVGTFAPGLLLPPHGLYPSATDANSSTWHNVDFDPAAFGTFF
ncbi:hypothetical protein EDB85DRAFT_435355 [Lactarius pseudohatsudake]|nr:hypothetical protein EDB85DRAFT_435355 [Lactarius pseudohatsudake]